MTTGAAKHKNYTAKEFGIGEDSEDSLLDDDDDIELVNASDKEASFKMNKEDPKRLFVRKQSIKKPVLKKDY